MDNIFFEIISFVVVMLLIKAFVNINLKVTMDKWSKERDAYDTFLKNNFFREYESGLTKKEINEKELELCNKFLEQNPKNYYAIEKKAELCFDLEKYEDAMKTYKILLKKEYIEHSVINYAKCLYILGNKDEAIKELDIYYTGSEGDHELHQGLGKLYMDLKEYDKAIEEFTKAIEIESNTPYFYADRADAYKLTKQYDKAIEDYTKAIELDESPFIYYADRARVYLILKKYDKYKADMKKGDELFDKPKDDSYYEDMAYIDEYDCFMECHDFDNYADDSDTESNKLKELELCNKLLEENPNNRYAFEQKAGLYFDLGRYNDSIEVYNLYFKKFNKEDIYTFGIAKCYYALDEKTKALEIMDNYSDRHKKDENYYKALADMNKLAKEYDDAIKNYTLAIECKPNDPDYYMDRAEIYKILNQQYKYEADMKKYDELFEDYEEDEKVDELNGKDEDKMKERDLGDKNNKKISL